MNTTRQVVQEFVGESLDQDVIKRLATGPEDHLVELTVRLSRAWNAWQDDRVSSDNAPVSHYFLGETRSEVEPLPLHKYLQLAMYFPVVAVPDPVEAGLGPQLQAAQLTGAVIPSMLRKPLIRGLQRLVDIAPLVDEGALELVPYIQLALSQCVQEAARNELEASSVVEPALDSDGRFLAGAYAVATAICSTAKYWPLASSPALWQRLLDEGSELTRAAIEHNLGVEAAIAEFELPSAARVPVDALLKLRNQEDAFAEFRAAFGVSLREALDREGKHGPKYALEYLRDALETRRERCQQAAKTTSALDGLWLPGGTTLLTGAIGYALADVVEGLKKLEEMAIGLAATGGIWVLAVLIQQAMQKRKARPAIAVYSALIDGSSSARDQGRHRNKPGRRRRPNKSP